VDPVQQPVFFYDLGSPQCYIVAETIMATLPVVPEWEPVLSWRSDAQELDRGQRERLVAEHDLQPLRWPPSWPPQSERAMLAATYAKRIGRGVAFSLAAFRQAFAGGRDLGDEDTLLIAGAACEMHPTALRKGIELSSTRAGLDDATRRARDAGARRLPAIQVRDTVYAGPDAIHQATAALQP
jgi:2-hydroxychromene-2-carboxylate isomerase